MDSSKLMMRWGEVLVMISTLFISTSTCVLSHPTGKTLANIEYYGGDVAGQQVALTFNSTDQLS
ncbi:MAG: hypothetical protein WBZ36_04250 [Candidatus Nitrosopolaris sp.]